MLNTDPQFLKKKAVKHESLHTFGLLRATREELKRIMSFPDCSAKDVIMGFKMCSSLLGEEIRKYSDQKLKLESSSHIREGVQLSQFGLPLITSTPNPAG